VYSPSRGTLKLKSTSRVSAPTIVPKRFVSLAIISPPSFLTSIFSFASRVSAGKAKPFVSVAEYTGASVFTVLYSICSIVVRETVNRVSTLNSVSPACISLQVSRLPVPGSLQSTLPVCVPGSEICENCSTARLTTTSIVPVIIRSLLFTIKFFKYLVG